MPLFFLILLCYVVVSQEVSLPADLRQHNLTQYNASLFNPTFSLDLNNPQSVSFWTRWQWQQIDADPTTLFLNYSQRINKKSGFGTGFFQHNTGVHFNTGGVLNYAYEIELNPIIKVSVGANLFGFQQQLADTRFLPDSEVLPIPIDTSDDFILQLAPGFNLSIENFSFGMASENLLDYNVTDKGANTETSDKIFMGMVSYVFPIMPGDPTAFLKPSIYLRTIPEQENQIGLNALFSTQKYWAQMGYNNFYGISVGGGGTILNKFSIGALVEFGTSASLNSKDASFEIVASYFLGNPEKRRKQIVNVFDNLNEDVELYNEEDTDAKMKEEFDKIEELTEQAEEELKKPTAEEKTLTRTRKKDSLDALKQETQKAKLAEQESKRAQLAADKKKEADAIAAEIETKRRAELSERQKREEVAAEMKRAEALAEADRIEKIRKEKEALAQAKKKEALELAEKQRLEKQTDSIYKAQQRLKNKKDIVIKQIEPKKIEKVTVQKGEKYEEVVSEGGIEPGFYLIANVFGTKKYFEVFMQDLKNKGISPGSFVRTTNNYNYVYLKRYNTISEAREARDSKFDGKYQQKTWIFRVLEED